ncbi:MAG: Fe-S cluster assembly protein SufD [Acidiphilium sp.]|nr:Fe-S cluster assembly protein SufD [Acidiphilium sp.]MDD4935118.1 Fe-S cluster assembly protein SufD [Acidiphilium sp.]
MTIVKSETTPYLAAYQAAIDTTEPTWLRVRRAAAIEQFSVLGFPTRRDEAWRFTNLRRLTKAPMPPAHPATSLPDPDAGVIESLRLAGRVCRLVLNNSAVVAAQSSGVDLPAGAWFGSIAEALETRPDLLKAAFATTDPAGNQPFAALNEALFTGGFLLALAPGVSFDAPFEIIHVNTDAASHPRCAILLGEGASATVMEHFTGSGAGWNNIVTCVDLGVGAKLHHVKLQTESPAAIHLAQTRATLAQAASYDSTVLSFGALLSREDIQVVLAGEMADFTLNGGYFLGGQQEATFAPFVEHRVPGCSSRQLVKGVIGGQAHGVFLGTIAVRPGADQTDARQTNRNLLLNAGTSVDTKPELEILADDVKCSHGATVGDLDDSALFYLQARGIDAATARRMLIGGFAADIIDASGAGETIRQHLHRHLSVWLEHLP